MKRSAPIVSAAAILAGTAGLGRAQTAYTIVASTDQPVPGLPMRTFADMGDASINQSGLVAFRAVLVDAQDAPFWSLWSTAPGAPILLAMEGQPAQVGPGRLLGPPSLSVPSLNAAGQIAATTAVAGADVTDSSDEVLFLADAAAFQPLIHTAVTGQVHSWISRPAMNAAGRLAVAADDGRDALFVGTPGGGSAGLARVARRDEPAPGLDQTIPTRFDRFSDPTIATTGEAVVRAVARPLNNNGVLSSGLWRIGSDGTVSLRLPPGAPAPGMGDGVHFGELSRPSFDAAGHICFRAQLVGDGITRSNDGTIWTEAAAGLALIAREGDPAPGLDAGVTFKYISAPCAAGDGLIGFTATVEGPGIDETNNTGIWRGTPGDLSPVVRRGWAAPRAGDALVFERFAVPVMNANGDVVFSASLADADPATPHIKALYAAADGGALQLIVGEQGFIPLEDCEHEQVERFAVHTGSRGDDGLGAPLNNLNQVVFEARLAGGTEAIIVADLESRLWSCDADRSGLVDVFDLLEFLDGWFASSAAADLTGLDGVDVFDLLAFLDCWFGGC